MFLKIMIIGPEINFDLFLKQACLICEYFLS